MGAALVFLAFKHPGSLSGHHVVSMYHQRVRSSSYSSQPQSQVRMWHAEFQDMNTTSNWVFPLWHIHHQKDARLSKHIICVKKKSLPLHPQVVFKGTFWKWEEEGPPTLELLDASDWQNLGEEKKNHCAPGLSLSCHGHTKENLQRGSRHSRRHQEDPKGTQTSQNPTPNQYNLELPTSKSRSTLQCN